ncbi:hypothetical protein N0V91_000237 [Didymella pomorum]|uniref:Uncharacterized protein n=1 Tax=Didymella pomorum TaxID=749634 RepID=A0A9W9DD21_9PLEO|nr:hypothetical protein N0V91_000237 [Didymella pomorum]
MVSTTIPIVGEDLQLHYFSLSTDETNVDIMARMRELSTGNRSIMHRFAKNTMHALLMREPAVGKALALRIHDLGAENVIVYEVKKDDALTKLCFGSVPAPQYGSLHAYLVDAVQDGHPYYTEVWCFYHATSGRMAAAWLLIALIIAMLIGLGVGVGCGDGGFGLDVGTGTLAVLTAIHLAILLRMMY